MSKDPVWPKLPRGGPRPDKRAREAARRAAGRAAPAAPPPHDHIEPEPARSAPYAAAQRREELRIFGLNASLAAFAARPEDLRKAWLSEARIPVLRDLMAWCVKHRLGYRVVADEDLVKLTGSQHHEGVCLQMRRPPELTLDQLLQSLAPDAPACLLWLDGVGNPHNFGAVLRSAAHFGIAAVLLPQESELALSGAACRVAEGGAEAVPLVRLAEQEQALDMLQRAGFNVAATLPRGGDSLFDAALPPRTVFVLGAEREGMQQALVERCQQRLSIPGSGQVESLNIASAVAVLLSAWAMRQA